jgi:hypothetical protein
MKVSTSKGPTWPVTDHVENRARRLNAMIAMVGIDPVQLARLRNGEAYLDARKACIDCHRAVECRAWLDAASDRSGPPNFCPNFAVLDGLKQDVAGHFEGRLRARLEAAGIDPAYVREVQPDTFLALEVACAGCEHIGTCARDLDARDAVERLATYCPNTPIVDELMIARVLPSKPDPRK